MQHLYFVRHGKSQAQVDGIWGGQIDTPLSEEGKQQARELAKDIKHSGVQFDLIISSPLSRTRHTAEIIAETIGYPVDKIQTHELLIERSFGILDGTPMEKEGLTAEERRKLDKVKGVETTEQLQVRSQKALAYLHTLPYDTILVVGHGTHGRALRRSIEGKPHHYEYEFLEHERFPNAKLVKLL